MAASKKKRTGARAAVVVVLCLVLVCVVAAAVALGLVSRRVKSFCRRSQLFAGLPDHFHRCRRARFI